jgi:hypothetical protein
MFKPVKVVCVMSFSEEVISTGAEIFYLNGTIFESEKLSYTLPLISIE